MSSIQYKEALGQKWIFSYAYSIYYYLFTVKIEIKSYKIFWAGKNYGKFCTSYWEWHSHVCKVWRFNFLCNFVINYSNIWFTGIFYNAIKYKLEFCQDYCKYLLRMIPRKFISYFSEFCPIYYEFLNLKWISRIFKQVNVFRKWKSDEQYWATLWLEVVAIAVWQPTLAWWA
jgi:hypothetical protein